MRVAVTVGDTDEQLKGGPTNGQSKCGALLLEGNCDTLGLTVHRLLIEPDVNGGAVLTIQNDTCMNTWLIRISFRAEEGSFYFCYLEKNQLPRDTKQLLQRLPPTVSWMEYSTLSMERRESVD